MRAPFGRAVGRDLLLVVRLSAVVPLRHRDVAALLLPRLARGSGRGFGVVLGRGRAFHRRPLPEARELLIEHGEVLRVGAEHRAEREADEIAVGEIHFGQRPQGVADLQRADEEPPAPEAAAEERDIPGQVAPSRDRSPGPEAGAGRAYGLGPSVRLSGPWGVGRPVG